MLLHLAIATINNGINSRNGVAVNQAGNGNTLQHHLVLEDKCKETRIREVLMKLCMQDFVDPKKNVSTELVKDSKRFSMRTRNS